MSLNQKNQKKKDKSHLFSMTDTQKTLHKNLEFTATEQYKLLRTNLSFALPENEGCNIIGVTSSMRGEGKSTTAVNLSYVFAEKGSKVLLIDADLRIPSIAKKLDIESAPGLADLLKGKGTQMTEFQTYLLPNWCILPSGDIPPNPSELLGSNRMDNVLKQLREFFDYLIVDLPPVNIVSDAVAISHLITGMIVVIREDYTEKKELERCMRQLKLSNVKVLGTVLNGSNAGAGYYNKYRKYRYYKYYKYYRYYSSDTAEKKK